jgi:transposase
LLFGLPGVRVERVERRDDGARVVHVITAEEAAAACPGCGVVATSVKEYVSTSPKDIPYGQGRILVQWNKTRWRCKEDYCQHGSFTEAIAQIPARSRTTLRLCTAIGSAIGDAARSVAEVADAHGVSWPTAHRAFVAHADEQLEEPQPTPMLGIDETRRGKPRWQRHSETGRWVRIRPMGHRLRRLDGRSRPVGTDPGPHRRSRHRLAGGPHTAVS